MNNNNYGAGVFNDKSQHQQQQQQQRQQQQLQCHSISDIAQVAKQRYGSIDTGNVCDVCRKTKFANGGVGQTCFNCKARCCLRCAFKYTTKTKVKKKFF